MARSANTLLCLVALAANAPAWSADEIDFSRDIRPILSDKCFQCHGPDAGNREADLRLDVREVAVDHEAIVPGDPDASSVIDRVTTRDPYTRMPPESTGKRLSASEQELLKRWIQEGAVYSEHWAFVAPRRPDLPDVPRGTRIRNPVDRFVTARLAAEGQTPAVPADRTTLVRRLYLDLIGLPPTPREVEEFLADDRDEAIDELIERLLKSPHFGEHWARWWLDAARYADSDGYEKDKPRSVWFYRDWVVSAMNRDLPYDDFIVQQIAGDLLRGAGQSELVATGFLRNSMVNEEGGADPEQFRVEGMFDRMDAIGKAILGLTTQCAQCHTHKYDPLSHREYYQLFAALNDFHEATATVFTPDQQRQRERVLHEISRVETGLKMRPRWEQELSDWAAAQAQALPTWRTLVPTERPWEGQKFRPLPDGSIVSESYAPTRATNTFRLTTTAPLITAFRLDALTHPQLPRGGPGRSIHGTGALTEFKVTIAPADNPSAQRTIRFVRAMSDVNPGRAALPAMYRDRNPEKDKRVTGPVSYAIDGDTQTAWSTDIGPGRRNQDRYAIFVPEHPIRESGEVIISLTLQQLHGGWNSDDNQNYLLGRYRFSVTSDAVPGTVLPSRVEAILRRPAGDWSSADRAELFSHWRTTVSEFSDENERIEALWTEFPEGESQLVVQAMAQSRVSHVFERGDFLKPAAVVEAQAPEFLHPFPKGDDPARLRFARWLVSRDAPTTARVIVNRIWQSYFGRGLVSTPEDFGFQSESPSHPQLIDWLAVELMDNDWSLRHIHRLIAGSATYQQSSVISPEQLRADAYNTLLGRGPRVRVNAEVVRDIALSASGLLNTTIGGPSVYPPAPAFLFQPPASYGPKKWDLSQDGQQYRRSLYVHSYRSVAYPPLQVFDAPRGDAACVRRQRSNTPLQSLVMLNEPQFVECARAMAYRVLREAGESDQERLMYAWRLCVSRGAEGWELAILERLLKQQRERVVAGGVDVAQLAGKSDGGIEPDIAAPWIVVCRTILNLDETITKQ